MALTSQELQLIVNSAGSHHDPTYTDTSLVAAPLRAQAYATRSFTVNTPYGPQRVQARSTGDAIRTVRELVNDRSCPVIAQQDCEWED